MILDVQTAVNICQYLFLSSSQWSVERSEPLSVGRRRHQVVLGGCQPEINQPTDKSPSCNITNMQICVYMIYENVDYILYQIRHQVGLAGCQPHQPTEQCPSRTLYMQLRKFVYKKYENMGYIIYYIRPGLIKPSWTLSSHINMLMRQTHQ